MSLKIKNFVATVGLVSFHLINNAVLPKHIEGKTDKTEKCLTTEDPWGQ